jgi:hypothetical protein
LTDGSWHVVHLEGVFEVEENKTYDRDRGGGGEPVGVDEQGPYWISRSEVRRMAMLYCPDCGEELQGGNDPSIPINFLVCPNGPTRALPAGLRPCHTGCLIACGAGRS